MKDNQSILTKLKARASLLKKDTYAVYLAYRHPHTPWYAKVPAVIVVAYAFSPIDLIPDFIPILGYLDDLILVPLGIALIVKTIPQEVMDECRKQAQAELKGKKPIGCIGAAVIILIWVGLAFFMIKKWGSIK